MNYLSLYFLVKTGLYYTDYIGFHWLANLLLALWAFWPLQRGLRLRRLLIWPLALALLWHDSLLPGPARVWQQLSAISGFSADYLLELLRRAFNPVALLGLAALVLVYHLLSRWLRFSTLALAGILSVPLLASLGSSAAVHAPADTAAGVAGGQEGELQAFYSAERQRKLVFPTTGAPPPFDLIVLHVCSLSWDDLDYVNQRNAPLLKRFDLVFSHFNSAASYSGPAALRVLRGNCGQTAHSKLYKATDPNCYTFPALAKAGFQTSGLLNHSGAYDDFAKTVETEAGLSGRMESNRAGKVQMQSFDGSPIYDDFGLLSTWWTQRQARGPEPVALYYNTITLHDGNRLPGTASRSSLDTYKPRLLKLLGDFDRFVTELEASGRPVVLVLIPEHGASLRGDKVQIPGMREIPDPKITLVPAAIKLIGMKTGAAAAPVVVTQDMGYFGINTLLADLLRDNPFTPGGRPLAKRLEHLQSTPFVAENDDVVMLGGKSGGYTMKSTDGTWLDFGKP